MREFALNQVVISTKLSPPAQRNPMVRRVALIKRLRDFEKTRLTVLTAPAGFGKTTLLAQSYDEARERGHLCGWVSLDEHDRDFRRLARHIVYGFRKSRPTFGESILRHIDAAARIDIPFIAGELANEISESPIPTSLFLDDYHLAASEDCRTFVSAFVQYAPERFRLIFATRAFPGLQISKRRLNNDLCEIEAKDLAFSLDEATLFLKARFDKANAEKMAISWQSICEGWAAGFQFLAGVHATNIDPEKFPVSYNGSLREIADYLSEVVLSAQSKEVVEFLLRTSILERFNASLASFVTKNLASHTLIDLLEESNLFVFRLDENRVWFRYHHMFRAHLLEILRRRDPTALPSLYKLAAVWCEENALGEESFQYALQTGDETFAAMVARRHADRLIIGGFIPEAIQLIGKMPPSLTARDPALNSLMCFCLWHTFQATKSEELLREVENSVARSAIEPGERKAWDNRIVLHRMGISVCRGLNPLTTLKHAERVSTELLNDFELGVFHNVTGIALMESNDLTSAIERFRDARRAHKFAQAPIGVACAFFLEALAELERGNLSVIDRLVFEANAEPVMTLESARYIHPTIFECIQAVVHYERNEISLASSLLRNNIRHAEEVGHHRLIYWVKTTYARILAHEGSIDEAIAQIAEMRVIFEKNDPGNPRLGVLAEYENLRLTEMANLPVHRHELFDDPLRWPGTAKGEAPTEWERLSCMAALGWCRRQLSIGRFERVIEIADAVALLASTSGRLRRRLEALCLKSAALYGAGRVDAAINEFGLAIRTASARNMVRAIADERKHIRFVAAEWLETPDALLVGANFRDALLTECARAEEGVHNPIDRPVSTDSISDRERKILMLVARGSSNGEIAERLGVTVHAIKWHLGKIYAKLNVENRTAAVTVAKSSNLL